MPCNSDYLGASDYEIELSQVCCLLDELDGKTPSQSSWRGYHPKVYNQHINGDALVKELCDRLQKEDVSKYSLEMQIWWRDHQKADKDRLEKELLDKKNQEEKRAALMKLTSYERGLLGFSEELEDE